MEEKWLAFGSFIMATLLLSGAYVIPELLKDKTYICPSTGYSGMCSKLSAPNSAGLSTRCYYPLNGTTKYKTCSSGWLLMNLTTMEMERSLCKEEGKYIYCCDTDPLKNGTCDFIIRSEVK